MHGLVSLSIHLQTISRLVELLEEDGVEVDERRFKSSTGIDGLSEPFVGSYNFD